MVEFRNSNGAVGLYDGGTPRTLTIKARANISGGYWVLGSSTAGVVSSGADSYATTEIEGYPVATQIGSEVIGLALQDIASGTIGPIARRGDFIMPAISGTRIGSIYAGWKVAAGSAGTVVAIGSNTLVGDILAGQTVGPATLDVGRAMTTSAKNGEYLIVSLNI